MFSFATVPVFSSADLNVTVQYLFSSGFGVTFGSTGPIISSRYFAVNVLSASDKSFITASSTSFLSLDQASNIFFAGAVKPTFSGGIYFFTRGSFLITDHFLLCKTYSVLTLSVLSFPKCPSPELNLSST